MLITQVRVEESTGGTEESPTGGTDVLVDGSVLEFAGGIPGFPASRQFRLERLAPELQPFCLMRSVEELGISFVLVAPGVLFPDYAIEIDEQHVASLGLESAADALVLSIVTLGDPPTVNLLGPLVVNVHTLAAAQVVQHQSNYRAAVPLTPRPDV
jgi:flagellar assembly factor FliW